MTCLARARNAACSSGRNVLAQPREGLEERADIDAGCNLLVQAGKHPGYHRLGRHPAQRQAFAQTHQFLIDASGVGGQPAQHLLGVVALSHRAGTQQVGQTGMEATDRAQAHAPPADQGFEVQFVAQTMDVEVQRSAVFGIEGRAVYRFGLLQVAPRLGEGIRLVLGGCVVQAVTVALVADIGRSLRVAPHRRFPACIEQRVQACGLVIGRCGGGCHRLDVVIGRLQTAASGKRDGHQSDGQSRHTVSSNRSWVLLHSSSLDGCNYFGAS